MQIQLVVIIVFAVFLKLDAVFHIVIIKQAARFGRIDAKIGRPRQRTAGFADTGIIFAGNGQAQNVIDAVKMAANAGKLLLQTVNVAVLLKALVDFAHFGHLFDPIILNFFNRTARFFHNRKDNVNRIVFVVAVFQPHTGKRRNLLKAVIGNDVFANGNNPVFLSVDMRNLLDVHFQFAVELIHAGNLLRNAVNFIEAAVDLAISLHAVAVIIEQKQHLFLIDAVLDIGLKNFAAVFLVIFLLNGVNFFRAVFDDVLSGNGAFKNRLLRLFQKIIAEFFTKFFVYFSAEFRIVKHSSVFRFSSLTYRL